MGFFRFSSVFSFLRRPQGIFLVFLGVCVLLFLTVEQTYRMVGEARLRTEAYAKADIQAKAVKSIVSNIFADLSYKALTIGRQIAPEVQSLMNSASSAKETQVIQDALSQLMFKNYVRSISILNRKGEFVFSTARSLFQEDIFDFGAFGIQDPVADLPVGALVVGQGRPGLDVVGTGSASVLISSHTFYYVPSVIRIQEGEAESFFILITLSETFLSSILETVLARYHDNVLVYNPEGKLVTATKSLSFLSEFKYTIPEDEFAKIKEELDKSPFIYRSELLSDGNQYITAYRRTENPRLFIFVRLSQDYLFYEGTKELSQLREGAVLLLLVFLLAGGIVYRLIARGFDALLQSEERYRRLYRHADSAFFILHGERVDEVSDAFVHLIGRESAESFEGIPFADLLAPDSGLTPEERAEELAIILVDRTEYTFDRVLLKTEKGAVPVTIQAHVIVSQRRRLVQMVVETSYKIKEGI